MKKYEFKDTFIKTCEFNKIDGKSECKKSRQSQKCIDNVCENINFTSPKKDILKDYYLQNGGSDEYHFTCPTCNSRTRSFRKFTNHIKTRGCLAPLLIV